MKRNSKKSKLILIKSIWIHLSKKRRKQIIFLPIIITLAGISEIFSVASVIPFLNALSNPEGVDKLQIIQVIYKIFGPLTFIDPFLI